MFEFGKPNRTRENRAMKEIAQAVKGCSFTKGEAEGLIELILECVIREPYGLLNFTVTVDYAGSPHE